MVNVSPLVKQIWIIIGVIFSSLAQGMVLSFSSIMLPAILGADSDVKVDLNVGSWIASVVGVGAMIGFGFAPLIIDLYGRKFVYLFFVIISIIGWFCLYFGSSVYILLFGRLLGGVGSSSTSCIGAIIIGEYTNPKDRGMFLNLKTGAIFLGNLLVHSLGHFFDWRTVILFAVSSALIAFFIVCTWPESPAWLASNKKFQECERSFYWLRGKNTDSVQELKELLRAQRERLSNKPITASLCTKVTETAKKFTQKDFIKPVIIIIFGDILAEASGKHIFPAFALQIVEEITGNKTYTFYYTLGLDILVTFSVILASILIKYYKRRTVLFVSGFLSLIVLYSTCAYIFLASKNIISKEMSYIPIILLGIYLILTNFGCATMTSLLIGEIFPLAHKGVATSVSCIFFALLFMVGMQITPFLLATVKLYGTFSILGIIMLILLFGLWLILPETKDKTLQEIEDYFINGKYTIVNSEEQKNSEEVKKSEEGCLLEALGAEA